MKKLTIFIHFLIFAAAYLYSENLHDQNSKYLLNETSRFDATNGIHAFITGEFLYWRAQEDGLFYAQTGAGNFGGQLQVSEMTGPLKTVDPSWDPGFRIGIGYNISRDKIDIQTFWTRFRTNKKDEINERLFPLWGVNSTKQDIISETHQTSFASGDWRCNLDVLDLEIGRSSWFGKHFSFRFLLGARGAWIDQRFIIKYRYYDGHDIPFDQTTEAKSDFKAGGLRSGFDLRYGLKKGFSLFSNASFSMLYARFDARYINTAINLEYVVNENTQSALSSNLKDKFNLGIGQIQYTIGLKWDKYFARDKSHIGLQLGWEQNIFAQANQMNHFMSRLSDDLYYQENGNLTFEGLTFKTRLDF